MLFSDIFVPDALFRLIEMVNMNNTDLKRRYDHYNKLLFNGELPDIPVEYAKLKTCGGVALAKVISGPSGRTLVAGSLKIQISSVYKRDDEGINGILIHEMIHIKFYSIGDFKEVHGYKFMAMLRKLSAKVGFDIPVTDKVVGLALAGAPPTKTVGVILLKKDSKLSVAVVSAEYLKENIEALTVRWQYSLKYNYVDEVSFLLSSGRIALTFPIQRIKIEKLKYYIIKEDVLKDDLENNSEILRSIKKTS